MNRRKFLVFVLLSTCLSLATSVPVVSSAAQPPVGVKQIAAPPGEILNAGLKLPDPAQSGIRSNWAMLPVALEQAPDGSWRWETEFPVANPDQFALMLLSPSSRSWQARLESPDRAVLDLKQARSLPGVTQTTGQLGAAEAGYPGEIFTFTGYSPGLWTVQVTAPASKGAGPDGYLLLSEKQSPYRLFSHLSSYDLLVGREVGLVASIYEDKGVSPVGLPAASLDRILEAEMHVQLPDGKALTAPMVDDGLHADGAAGDGLFGSLIKAGQAGEYIAQVVVRGQTAEGQPFVRTSEHIFPVVDSDLTLTDTVTARVQGSSSISIPLAGVAHRALPDQLQVAAEVWGTNSQGAPVAVAWIGGMVTPKLAAGGRVVFTLNLDGRWIGLAGARAPFELRQVRVQDPDTHIPIARLETVKLQMRTLPRSAQQAIAGVSTDMLTGARPDVASAADTIGAAAFVGGRKLVLVHGYCSGGNPWPTADFTNYAVFSDPSQNRSHDQFARMIRDYGAQFDSFGGVGHSQGGAALLHLYTYYWSGLDSSSGPRLLQSVGTPYQGTALAGNLALLGQIFGVGCGTNWDLTYDGAALWLAGIPAWARSRLYYWTTSFTDVWWRYDYCHIGSDLLLSDPDDGAVERWSGQVPGAHNMGHKTGWCHTVGMRDPAQYMDHTRNAEMNASGNR
jgi:hypothetical protein